MKTKRGRKNVSIHKHTMYTRGKICKTTTVLVFVIGHMAFSESISGFPTALLLLHLLAGILL